MHFEDRSTLLCCCTWKHLNIVHRFCLPIKRWKFFIAVFLKGMTRDGKCQYCCRNRQRYFYWLKLKGQ